MLKEGIEAGPYHFDDVFGLYCEGEHRQAFVMNYITHEGLDPTNPHLAFAAMFELVVDRSQGRSHHSQWIQPKKTVVSASVVIHVFNISDVSTKTVSGSLYAGWFRVHGSSLMKIKNSEAL